MKLGDTGQQVATLQAQLNTVLNVNAKVTGVYDLITKSHVQAFQAKYGLQVTGVVTPGDQAVLNRKLGDFPVVPFTLESLCRCLPGMKPENAKLWLDAINTAFKKYEITTINRAGMYLANLAVECGNFAVMQENLNYSAQRLAAVWPHRFGSLKDPKQPNALALQIAGHPDKIADYVYGGRMGNGAPETGDGYNYRGQGPVMLTGKAAYEAAGKAVGVDLVKTPALIQKPSAGMLVAGWFWQEHNVAKYADVGDFDGVCDMINIGHKTEKVGDAIGYAERLKNWQHISIYLKG